ncbi:preprotein translocase subunit SecA [Streptomyces geranii]|uniref:preprotein translocase subunit SecA n=1 Tax=Streptomyces geranii TaxID=2058923 RepID=UPI001E50A650|nr:preprotein translocase subunit SecA [Streptomyces geranii]
MSPVFDPHAKVIIDSWASLMALMGKFDASDDPAVAVGEAFDEAVAEFASKVRHFDPIRLIEVARLAFLPLVPAGMMPVTAESSAAPLELLALTALVPPQEAADVTASPRAPVAEQEMSHFVSTAREEIAKLLHLAQLRSFAAADATDKLALVSLLVQGGEVWMRNSSYPEMVEETNRALLDGDPEVQAALVAELGFDACDALAVLDACHDLQMVGLNDRIDAMRDSVSEAMASTETGRADEGVMDLARSSLMRMFEPEADEATVAVEDVVRHTGITRDRVKAVVERFRLDLKGTTPAEAVDAFTAGQNPLRTRPIIIGSDERVMLPHPGLHVFAVRENLEEHLKTSTAWNKYAKHRGDLLESRTRDALGRVLPGAHYRDGFEYYVPANAAEAANADPAKYTKRVEGDHLVLVDDVAIVVEDKAVAFSALSRGGKKTRIRNDLTGIVTKAAEQAGRIRDRIEQDGGLRIEEEGWVDLSHIREIHTIAVSLDDISPVLTATAELVRADLLSADNIPWTVSLHDLELITELVDRPAEFLLYLRRRRNPNVTLMFSAPDELDLFLHFFEAGLWVEPDPAQVRTAFPFIPAPSPAELRRYRSQQPTIVTSRTDALDQWFHTKHEMGSGPASALKPHMAATPTAPLVDELQKRNVTGWLSIGATLLSGSHTVQHKFARYGAELVSNPSPNGQGRSITVPITASADPAEGWLFAWATRPAGESPDAAQQRVTDYVRVKKHQLNLPRGVVFLYDESTGDLREVFYDGHIGPLDASLTATMRSLRPASDLQRTIHPNAMRPPRKTSNTKLKQNKPKRKR